MNIDELRGEELFSFLRKNKTELIQVKKSSLKLCDATISTVQIAQREPRTIATKDAGATPEEPAVKDTLDVTIVCNAANIIDSHMDMLTSDAYTESVAKRGNTIPHILDHNQSAIAHVGDVTKVYTKVMPVVDLGINALGTTTALLMESTVRKDYNEKVFQFYSNGKINQHSIGLSYDNIFLAINSSHENDKVEKAVWDEYYPKVINKDAADKRGYFWVVPKVDIRENSAVLFGANPATPTLSVKREVQEILSLGNDEIDPIGSTVLIQPIGNTMTLEEAQGKIISLTEELAKAKSDLALVKLEATTNEKQRTLSILKAQVTFGTDTKLQKAAMSFIEKDVSLETAITSFEVIKEALQDATHVGTTEQGASLVPTDTGTDKSFSTVLDKALETVGKSDVHNLFAGVK